MGLELRKGSHLYTSQGEDLGRIAQFVVAPKTSEVTHVIVDKGVFFHDDRVVPVEIIDRIADDRVSLSDDVDVSSLPRFVSRDYVRLGATEGDGDYAWRYPIAFGSPFPAYPTYPTTKEAGVPRVNDPAVQEEVEKGGLVAADAPVLSADGEKVGRVSEIEIDAVGRLSHLVVDLGFLDGERVLPGHWIEAVDNDGVKLAVNESSLEALEPVG